MQAKQGASAGAGTCAGRLASFFRFFSRRAASAVAACALAAVAAAASEAALPMPPGSPVPDGGLHMRNGKSQGFAWAGLKPGLRIGSCC